MEAGKKRSTSKKAAKQVVEEQSSDMDAGVKQQEFVEKMKKRATVKTYGIDNVLNILRLKFLIGFNL